MKNKCFNAFCGIILSVLCSCAGMKMEVDTLEADFKSPKAEQRPYVWWHWMGPNFSLDGITRDLEAMKKQGIGGATIFNITSAVQESQAPTKNNPWPNQVYRGEEYWKAIKHAASEAERLGLEIGLHNTVGYSTTGGPWIDESRSMQRVLYTETRVSGGKTINVNLPAPAIPDRRGWGGVIRRLTEFKDIAVTAVPASEKNISPDDVIELTKYMDKAGNLVWDAPAGEWIVTRFVYASTGVAPHPLPDELIDNKTFEVDKMTVKNTEYHWKNVINPLKEHIGSYMGKSFRHFLIDSYEAGLQSWCDGFRDMFIREKGYDPLPWMTSIPSVFDRLKQDRQPKRIVGDSLLTSRFEWDYRDFIGQMFVKNGWQPAVRMINKSGCKLQFEPYGGPIDILSSVPVADLPMGEFWTPNSVGIRGEVAGGARAAGARIIGAEAFTGSPNRSQWVEDPAYLKRSGDYAFITGVNRLILHHWVHQPYDDKYKPGMSMGWWGTHFGRNQTWADAGKGYFDYLGRCQAMLQHGEQVVNYITIGKASGGDAISWRNFIRQAKVKDGDIVLTSGRRYKFAELPETDVIQPELIVKIYKMLKDGAIFVSKVKPVRGAGLTDYIEGDKTIEKLADVIWPGESKENRVGKGRLLKMKPTEALDYLGVDKALVSSFGKMRYVHRKYQNNDMFFVLNDSKDSVMMDLSFNITDRIPELWDPYTGKITDLKSFDVSSGRLKLLMGVSANRSFFIVFRRKIDGFEQLKWEGGQLIDNSLLRTDKSGTQCLLLNNTEARSVISSSGRQGRTSTGGSKCLQVSPSGRWDIEFCSKADGSVFSVSSDSLFEWSMSDDKRIKYFSGTATYTGEFILPYDYNATENSVELNLGELKNIAEISVNGQAYFNLWHSPFAVSCEELDKALHPGVNKIQIKITNTWRNSLIGDEQYVSDLVWGKERDWGKQCVGRPLAEYPDWFINNTPRPSKERKTFVIWNYFTKDSELEKAGLWGPVKLKVVKKAKIELM